MIIREYNRQKAVEYAEKWAYRRNPKYYNFDSLGGDCTSFISQCIYAGSGIMNYTKDIGWYYNSINDRAPAWSGVEFLHNFLINNKSVGPFGKIVTMNEVEKGDIVQLSFDGRIFAHTLIIVGIDNGNNIFTASHTGDSYMRNISTYVFKKIRFIKIQGVRKYS